MSNHPPSDVLVRDLATHNPWWDDGIEAFDLPARQRSDFYQLARPSEAGSQFEDQGLLALVGRRGVGKTTLLKQFIHHRIEAGADPAQFCYIPFDADPLYQLQSTTQLRQAIRYYESRIFGSAGEPSPQFILLDDVNRIEHPSKPESTNWGTAVRELIDPPDRYVAVTASAGVQIDRELDRVGIDDTSYDIQPILPEKFRDYIFTLYGELESGEDRITPTPIREGPGSLPRALENGDIQPLVDELRAEYEKVAGDARRIQSQVVDYLAMGGILSYAQDGAVESAATLDRSDYQRLRDDVRDALYQEVPGFESIQTIADLERLCAVAARSCGRTPITYQRLVELFDVDRRTITDSYLPALRQLYLLTGATEYDNSRPRSVRLFLRDPGLIVALTGGVGTQVLDDYDRETDLARVAAFDHTMRFAYGIEASQGRERRPEVQFWNGSDGEVEFVFEIDGTPIPIGFQYRSPIRESAEAVVEFLDSFESPVGFVLTGDTVSSDDPVSLHDERIVHLPFWFYLLLC